jgi:hypothetical protein
MERALHTVSTPMTHPLRRAFGRAGLPLQVLDRPLMGDDPVFGLDIQPRRAIAPQVYRMFPGDEQVRVNVIGHDPGLEQLVPNVKEPRRSFDVPIRPGTVRWAIARHPEDWLEWLARQGDFALKDVVSASARRRRVIIRQTTPGSSRHMLLGRDERQLFVAQLQRPASTVRAAHDLLRASDLGSVRSWRQGEWFFRAPTPDEREHLDEAIDNGDVYRRCAIDQSFGDRAAATPMSRTAARRAHQHMAERMVVARGQVFVRGKIRHPEHKTLRFPDWVIVLPNRESGVADQAGARALGIYWID